MNPSKLKLAIVGLGYVGLPLAIEFGKTFNNVFGFDINKKRIDELNLFTDITGEISSLNIRRATKLKFSNNLSEIKNCNCYIIAVPTPVNKKNIPDLKLLINACKLVAKVLKKNDVVIYESTVYPGATEEVCVPILEKFSYKIQRGDRIGILGKNGSGKTTFLKMLILQRKMRQEKNFMHF
jgi:UDP-N-acetyl-D-galactosamine dehydrogenase